jgi:multiple sugar transport system ATP-binding protein
MGDRVAVLKDGLLQQVDTPRNMYDRPANLFVAGFIGSPAMNLVEATVDGDTIRFGQFHLPFDGGRRPDGIGDRVVLGIRPETFEDAAFAAGLPTLAVRVSVLEELGSDVHLFFEVDAQPITAEVLEAAAEGGLLADQRALFTARVDARTRAGVGDTVELAVDARRFHFFDPDSGARLAPSEASELAGVR